MQTFNNGKSTSLSTTSSNNVILQLTPLKISYLKKCFLPDLSELKMFKTLTYLFLHRPLRDEQNVGLQLEQLKMNSVISSFSVSHLVFFVIKKKEGEVHCCAVK